MWHSSLSRQRTRRPLRDAQMVRVIDLSIPVSRDMPKKWAGKFKSETRRIMGDFVASDIAMSVHLGTHIDAPLHYFKEGKSIDDFPAEFFFGEAAVIRLQKGPSEAVTAADLENAGGHVQAGDIVLIATGWSNATYGTESFWADSPYLSKDAIEWLVGKRVKMVGTDFTAEYAVRLKEKTVEDYILHKTFLENGILNLEYVTNLGDIRRDRVKVYALPLKLHGLEASPTRAIAVEE